MVAGLHRWRAPDQEEPTEWAGALFKDLLRARRDWGGIYVRRNWGGHPQAQGRRRQIEA